MKAKEQAIKLVSRFTDLVDSEITGEDGFEFNKNKQVNNAKLCALIVTDVVRVELSIAHYKMDITTQLEFWDKVVYEIQKL